MSVNAVALRRILRSIGQHVPPSGIEAVTVYAVGRTYRTLEIGNRAAKTCPTTGGRRGVFRGRQLHPREQRRYQHDRRRDTAGVSHSQVDSAPQWATQSGLIEQHSGVSGGNSALPIHALGGSGRETPRTQISEALGHETQRAPAPGESQIQSSSVANPRADSGARQSFSKNRTNGGQHTSIRASTVQPRKETADSMRAHGIVSEDPSEQPKVGREATGQKIMRDRHGYPEHRAWQDAFNILVGESQSVKHAFGKRMVKVSLPQGIVAKWARDPGESILEILQRTGCTVRTIPSNPDNVTFPSLTLWGTPAQNAEAARLMRESDLLIALGQDDLNASHRFADHQICIEDADARQKDRIINQGQENGHESIGVHDQNLPLQGIAQNATARVVDTGNAPPIRAVLQQPRLMRSPLHARWDASSSSWSAVLDPTAFSGQTPTPDTSTAFALQIMALTRPQPLQVSSSGNRQHLGQQFHQHIKDKLVELNTSEANADLITTESSRITFKYLAQNRHFPAIRSLLQHFESSKIEIGADAFIPMFQAAMIDGNINTFRHYLKFMQNRNIKPLPEFWLAFKDLTLTMYPAKAALVHERMLDLGVYEANNTKIQTFNKIASELLLEYMRANPEGSFMDFVRETAETQSSITQLSTASANAMIRTMLRHDKEAMAYEIVDALVMTKRVPNTITLNTFLSAARRLESVEMAVTALRKFHNMRVHSWPMASDSTPDSDIKESFAEHSADSTGTVNRQLDPVDDSEVAESAQEAKPSRLLSRHRDLSVYLNHISFALLLKIAWERRSWNVFRVFWRYACMAGYRDSALSGKMVRSLRSGIQHEWQAVPIRRKGERRLVKGDVLKEVSRGMMWDLWAARFAIGLSDGLRGNAAAAGEQSAPTNSTPNSAVAALRPLSSRSDYFIHCRDVLDADQAEAQSLRPLRSISTLAERAAGIDAEWKQNSLGLPKGLDNPMWRKDGKQAMLEVMLSEAIDVPVAPGDGSSIRA